jgi:hypothetical protein
LLPEDLAAELISRGVARKQDFRDAFPGETDDDLSTLRQKFLGQAYQRRQELLLTKRPLLSRPQKARQSILST